MTGGVLKFSVAQIDDDDDNDDEEEKSIVAIETNDCAAPLYSDHVTRTTIVQIVRSSNYTALFIN